MIWKNESFKIRWWHQPTRIVAQLRRLYFSPSFQFSWGVCTQATVQVVNKLRFILRMVYIQPSKSLFSLFLELERWARIRKDASWLIYICSKWKSKANISSSSKFTKTALCQTMKCFVVCEPVVFKGAETRCHKESRVHCLCVLFYLC